MSDPSRAEGPDLASAMQDILEEARRTAGGGARFAEGLLELGVEGEKGPYSESAISNWVKGRTTPPADVLLAAAWLARISVDQHLFLEAATVVADATAMVDDLRRELGRLQTDVVDLYLRLGYPLPDHLQPSESPPASKVTRRGA